MGRGGTVLEQLDAGDDVGYIRELYAARYRRLVGQLVGVTGDVCAAEELVQEAFMKALQRPRQFRALDNPEAWLRTVAVNGARSRWRRTGLWRALAPRIATAPVAPDEVDGDAVTVIAALRRIPQSQREAVALHYLGDLSLLQVAETLGVPVGTVKARLSRGRESLRPLLADEWSAGAGALSDGVGSSPAFPPSRTTRKEAPRV